MTQSHQGNDGAQGTVVGTSLVSGEALGGRGESLRLGGVRSGSQTVRIEALIKCALISRIKSSENKDFLEP